MLWTTVRQGAKSFALTSRLGTTIQIGKRKRTAVQVTPISYLPPSLSCPELAPDGPCSIHADKPSRCRTMPFTPFREEWDQAELLIPRTGWECDTSAAAPVVYRDKEIVHREDFDHERRELVEQASTLRAYSDALPAKAPNVAATLETMAKKPGVGRMVLNFTAIVSRLPQFDMATFARQQIPVLTEFAQKTAGISEMAEFHQYYSDNATGMERFLERN